eukprot:591908-Ditylum_brightwellii.AAC.1
MVREEFTAVSIEQSTQALSDNGIPYKVWGVHPKPFTLDRCMSRLPELANATIDAADSATDENVDA